MGEIAVVVPVIERPNAAAPFMESWRRSTSGLSAVYAVAGPGDAPTVKAWRAAGARRVLRASGPKFSTKVNAGYRWTAEPWLLLVGDDVEFTPGWEQAALKVAEDTGALMISTNDGSGDGERLSQLAVHPMISRVYIDKVGCMVEGPGTVAHEGYHHWYVDQEWSLLARARGHLAYAPKALIRHNHPSLGTGEWDPIYQLAQQGAEADKALCLDRLGRHFQGGVECIRP